MEQTFQATNTSKRDWKKDCLTFKRANASFKVSGVSTDDQRKFILEFAAKHDLAIAHGSGIVYLTPHASG